jgi:hypothetical protein
MRNLTLVILMSGFLSHVAAHAQAEGYRPRVGEPHADSVLPSLSDGEPMGLSEYRGRKVLLVHFASW